MSPIQTYFTALHFVRSTGAGVAETSHYPALAALLDAVGAPLQPAVRCVGQLANLLGAGSPDFGLYAANQFPRRADLAAKPSAGEKPARGVVEAKGTAADVLAIAASPQVAKYLAEYGLVLVTNYRDFLLVSRGPGGATVLGERYMLADSDPAFWTALGRNPAAIAARHEVGLGEFLRRALLHEAPLTRPQDVAFFLASYARHALRLLDEQADLPALKPSAPPWKKPSACVSRARRASISFAPRSCRRFSTGCSARGCSGAGNRERRRSSPVCPARVSTGNSPRGACGCRSCALSSSRSPIPANSSLSASTACSTGPAPRSTAWTAPASSPPSTPPGPTPCSIFTNPSSPRSTRNCAASSVSGTPRARSSATRSPASIICSKRS